MPSSLGKVINTLEEIQVFLQRIDSKTADQVCDCIQSLNGYKSAEDRILEVLEREGGEYSGLYQLSVEAGVNYSHAWSTLRDMELRGMVSLERVRAWGRPIMIRRLYGS